MGSLIGHNDIRRSVMGSSNRTPGATEQQAMESLVEQAMKDGCQVGLSTGLIYLPGMYAKTPEVVGLAKVTAKYNGVYATPCATKVMPWKPLSTQASTHWQRSTHPGESHISKSVANRTGAVPILHWVW